MKWRGDREKKEWESINADLTTLLDGLNINVERKLDITEDLFELQALGRTLYRKLSKGRSSGIRNLHQQWRSKAGKQTFYQWRSDVGFLWPHKPQNC